MIQIHPKNDSTYICPICNNKMEILGYYIPGMRALSELTCQSCERNFFIDLPIGHAINGQIIIEKKQV